MGIVLPQHGQLDWDVTLNNTLTELSTSVNGVTVTNAPAVNQVLTATSTTQAQWENPQLPAGLLYAVNNLSDVQSIPAARANLGLGNAALRNVGSTSGTVAAGDDPRFPNSILQVPAPTGVAATDTVAIQIAVNAAAASGGIVQLQGGTYMLNATINIPTSNTMVIQGIGWGTVVKLAPNTDQYAFTFSGADTRITMRDMTIDGNLSQQSTSPTVVSGGINGAGAVACRFDNIHFTACKDTGLILAGQSNSAFGHNNRIIGCLFDQSLTSTGLGRGIYMTSNDENQIIGCDFEYLGGSGGTTGFIHDTAGTQFIIGCNFVNGGNNARGVWIQNAASTKVLGCNFDGTSGDSIFAAATKCVISNNTIFSPGIAGTAGQASGIYLEFGTSGNIVSDNTISSAPTNGVSRGAIRESGDGGAGKNSITDNQIITEGTWGFAALDLSGVGSRVRDNLGGGVVGDVPSVIEGSNGHQGLSTLVAGTVTVANASVNINSRIQVTSQTDGGTPGWLRVSSINPGVGFTITSSSATDTSTVAWYISQAL